MDWFISLSPILQGLLATTFTYFITMLGASLVFFFKDVNKNILVVMLGFSAGVMIAASFWSLLAPAISLLEEMGKNAYLPVAIGFLVGGFFVSGADIFLAKVENYKFKGATQNKSLRRCVLLTLAVTLHNIPEGLSVGVAFGSVASNLSGTSVVSAMMLAVGIGLQNFPEGVCVALPLRKEGYSRAKAFFIGQASGIVEPIAGVIGVIAALTIRSILPIALAFSAGAMIAVVCAELIPEAFKTNKLFATLGVLSGFVVMMILDVALG